MEQGFFGKVALIFKDHIFYHIPKCGGSYVRKIIKNIEPDNREICWTHSTPFESRSILGYSSPIGFAVVRHPLTWYESYFRYRTSNMKTWVQNCYFDKLVMANTYEKFIRKVLAHTVSGSTSYVAHLYSPFLQVNYLLKMENLDRDLKMLLAKFNYSYEPIKPVKVSPRSINVSLSKELYERLAISEEGLSLTLGYERLPSQ